MKIAQKIAGIFILLLFFIYFILFYFAEARPQPVHYTVRGHQKSVQIPLYRNLRKKVTLAEILLTTEKGQRRGYSQAVFWHNKFVLRFYGPVNPMGSCRARSVYLTTRLLGRLSPPAVNQYCAHSFARNWQLPFLNQRKGENDRRKYFMISLHERMLPTSAGVEPATSWSPVGRRIQLSHRGRLFWHNKDGGLCK